jgi:hypothetical protein
MACKSFEATHTLAEFYIKSAMFRLQNKLDEFVEAGECYKVSIPNKSYMTEIDEGREDIHKWVEDANIIGANFGRPPMENIFFFVSINLPDGGVMYSLESRKFIQDNKA